MFKRIDKIYIITGALFLFAFLLLLFNIYSEIFSILFSIFISIACACLAYILIKNYKKYKIEKQEEKEVIIMEIMADTESASMSPYNSKQLRVLKREKFSKFVPIIVSCICSAFFLFAFIYMIVV